MVTTMVSQLIDILELTKMREYDQDLNPRTQQTVVEQSIEVDVLQKNQFAANRQKRKNPGPKHLLL